VVVNFAFRLRNTKHARAVRLGKREWQRGDGGRASPALMLPMPWQRPGQLPGRKRFVSAYNQEDGRLFYETHDLFAANGLLFGLAPLVLYWNGSIRCYGNHCNVC
jgi:hypothetical protein